MICNKCKEDKFPSDFYKRSRVCKKCYNDHCSDYRRKNSDKSRESQRKWRERNRDKIKIISKEYRKNNIEKSKNAKKNWYKKNIEKERIHRIEYKKNNPEKLKEIWKKYRESNKEKLKINRKEYCKKNRLKLNLYAVKRRKSNVNARISHNIRGRIRDFLKNRNLSKNNRTFKIIGCTPTELKIHLQNRFKDGMSWKNYGYYGWHIDHIIPLDSGKDEKEIYELCHFSNLQPLWHNDNQSKTNKIL